MRLPGGRQAQPGVATGQSVLAWRLGYTEVFASKAPHPGNFEPISPTVIICNTFWLDYRVFGKDRK
jgi:hypothetical protein